MQCNARLGGFLKIGSGIGRLAGALGGLVLCAFLTLSICAQDTAKRELTPEMQKTLKEIEVAANSGNRDAQYKLGLLYIGANGFPINFEEAHKWFTVAMKNGSANAIHNLAILAERGLGEEADPMKAFDLYRLAGKHGVAKAAYKVWALAQKLNEGSEEPVLEQSTAFEHLVQAAEGGVVEAEFAIAREYLTGAVVKQDFLKSIDYLRRAAGKGDLASTRLLGEIFTGQVGDYQPKPDEAIEMLLPHANEGDSVSQRLLGDIYSLEAFGKRNLAEATKWYEKAIRGGSDKARVNLGLIYADRENKSIYNPDKAEKLLYDAAKANLPTAQFAMYQLLSAPGRNNDARARRQAMIWLKSAAKLNHTEAQGELARRFFKGDVLPHSLKEAYIWSTIALDNGQQDAALIREAVKKMMSPVQVAEADSEAQFRARQIAKTISSKRSSVSS